MSLWRWRLATSSAGNPENTFMSSALKISWAHAMETPASSQILEGLESTLSFCLSPTLSLLLRGVSSSTDGVGDAVPAVTGVGEEGSTARIGAPLSMIRMDLVPIADKGSSFLFLILEYMSLLNFVVISTRREHLLIIIQVSTKRKRAILTNLVLTLFSLKVVPTFYCFGVLYRLLNTTLVLTLEFRPSLNCTEKRGRLWITN